MRCQTELIMHLSLQAERVLIQNLHVPFSRAGPGYLAHCLPPRPSLYPDPSAQVCRHGTILLRAFRSTTNGASHVLCVTVNEGSQSGPAEASVTCSNPNILCMLANANLAVSLPHIIWLLGVFRGGCDFRPANGDHSISAHTHTKQAQPWAVTDHRLRKVNVRPATSYFDISGLRVKICLKTSNER